MSVGPAIVSAPPDGIRSSGPSKVAVLRELERKVLWLSTWMIHHANHLRPHHDGLKVGGHQASSASVVTLMTGLYLDVLRPEDRVAVKPHASPVFHAIQYLLGLQTRERLEHFRALGGAQAYPSRTKDHDGVDFSTGSVGLGVGVTVFASLVQDYLHLKGLTDTSAPSGRMIAIMGDAELDEGNVFEAMYEGWKHDVRNLWWVMDYNRQSLDSIVEDQLFSRITGLFESLGWNIRVLKYGKLLEEVFQRPGGEALRQWLDACPNVLYSALVYKGGSAWREHLHHDLGGVPGISQILHDHDDPHLHALMTNLGGHDMETVLAAFHAAQDDTPTCFLAYTIKGYGLPFAGHKDNHAGLLLPAQIQAFQEAMNIPDGAEWNRLAGLNYDEQILQAFLESVPFIAQTDRCLQAPRVSIPHDLPVPQSQQMSTQAGFGRLLYQIGQGDTELARRIVTVSPDVTVSTSLGPWVNQRGIFDRRPRKDVFQEQGVTSPQRWRMSPQGQHIELGIAENNLFLLLAALGLSGPLFGQNLIPIGTVYDPFISRGLDALNYACYQGARFLLVGTPSGLTLAPEGGAHQSILTPLIGIGQPGLTFFEPAYVDELAVLLSWSFQHIQEQNGGSVYLRLTTRSIDQPQRPMTEKLREDIVEGGTWLVPPDSDGKLAIVCSGAVLPEATTAWREIIDEIPGAGLLEVTSADRLHSGWLATHRARSNGHHETRSHVERLLDSLSPEAVLVTVLDGHPLSLSWLGGVARHRVMALGTETFGQSGDIPDLYREYRLDVNAIIATIARACLEEGI